MTEKPTKYANPGPIGLMAFGITTVLLNVLNAGLIDKSAIVIIVAYGALHGGLVQVLAGMWEVCACRLKVRYLRPFLGTLWFVDMRWIFSPCDSTGYYCS